jgi:outer membrane lipoprotein SlyB
MKRTSQRFLMTILILLSLLFSLTFLGGSITSAVAAQTTTVTRTTVVRHRYRHKRTFWQRHRDKLTVAGTGLAGAGIGGLAGGRKGAAIGAAVGAGSGALYTYKIRKRHRHARRY